jgi:hypothetical protein
MQKFKAGVKNAFIKFAAFEIGFLLGTLYGVTIGVFVCFGVFKGFIIINGQ